MSVANLQAYALSNGMTKSYQSISQAEQTQLRYNYLMNTSKDVQGDFNETSNTFANQMRITQTNLSQMGASIAVKVLPYLNKLLLLFNNQIVLCVPMRSLINSVLFLKYSGCLIIIIPLTRCSIDKPINK